MMFCRTNLLRQYFQFLVALAAILLAGCGGDGDGKNTVDPPIDVPEVSAAMAGVWNYQTTAYDCVTNEIVIDLGDSGTDTLCAGDPMYEDEDDDIFVNGCEVSDVGTNSFRIECDLTETVENCTVAWSVHWDYSFTNTTITASGTMSVDYSGSGCPEAINECYNLNLTATRVGSVPSGACSESAARAVSSRFLRLSTLKSQANQ